MVNSTKSLLATLLFGFANVASASVLYIDTSMSVGSHIDFMKNRGNPTGVNRAVTGPYSKGTTTLGTLMTDMAGTVSATDLGDETTVAAGEMISLMYQDRKSVTNGTPNDYATFAMHYTQSGGKVYTHTNAYGMCDSVIGFSDSDSAKADADYDDFAAGVKSAPSVVPLPAAAWLFGSALFGFMMVSNRRKV